MVMTMEIFPKPLTFKEPIVKNRKLTAKKNNVSASLMLQFLVTTSLKYIFIKFMLKKLGQSTPLFCAFVT